MAHYDAIVISEDFVDSMLGEDNFLVCAALKNDYSYPDEDVIHVADKSSVLIESVFLFEEY